MPHLFCFGLGYTALAFASRLDPKVWRVSGTCRSEARAAFLVERGFDIMRFDGSVAPSDRPAAFDGVTHILQSVPPDHGGDPVLACWGRHIATLPSLAWFGYLSTTGVYGDRGGGWVDETSATTPTGPRGLERLAAERGWLALWHQSAVPAHVFRLAGIYGPGRSALDTIRSGRAQRILKPGHVFSRIHVDDIAAVLERSIAAPNPGAVYNLCDDEPAPTDEVLSYAAELLGVPAPPAIPFEQATLSEMGRSFYADHKRVANDRIKRELGVRLTHPSYRAGLRAVLAEGG
jgi:dTDP-4-dehydrorhamnose reductase